MDEYMNDVIITNKIYARPDESGTVTKLFSSVFEKPQPGDIMLEEGNADYHAHVHLKYQTFDEHGRYNYRIADGQLELIPEEDKPPVLPVVPPPTVHEIAAENKLLRNQVEALIGQNDFQEELIVELATIVYA